MQGAPACAVPTVRAAGYELRNFLVALVALPVLAVVYATEALRRSLMVRLGAGLVLGAVVGIGIVALARPTPTVATPPTEVVPLTQAAFRNQLATDIAVDAAIAIEFSTPMEPASVAAALDVEPSTAVDLAWDADGTTLTIAPVEHWTPGAYHTITVEPGALARSGRPLTVPARSTFLTRAPVVATLAAEATVGTAVPIDTSFTVAFDRPVDPASIAAAVTLDPPLDGVLTALSNTDASVRYRFDPSGPLEAGTEYRLIVDGVRDADGLPVGLRSLQVRTIAAPAVVRFRPRADTKDVEREVDISVRFTRAMDRASTTAAFEVTADGKAVTGKISFAEGDTVLVFDPDKTLPYDSEVLATVAVTAVSAEGAPLEKAGKATFQTKPKPKPPATSGGGSSGGSSTGGGGSGSSVGSGSWTAVERYYLGLMNCTRTGGVVTASGDCSSPGGRNVKALTLSAGISDKVARPYAKLLATRGECSHFIGGNPGDRLRKAGYTNYTWAENIGCRSGNPYSAVLGSHRYFQSEKSYNGGHYVNLMNAKYDRVGIGVWVSSGRVRLVVDFYHP